MSERFYAPDLPVSGRLTLRDDEARHLARVRRVQPGEVVEVFDGRGASYRAEVLAVARGSVELAVRGEALAERVAPIDLTLATAVPKGERFDWLVEKATELGVARLVPLKTERSVVDPRAAKLGRLARTVIEATKQCGRSRLLELTAPRPLNEYLREESARFRLLADPDGSAAWPCLDAGRSVALVVGPEGGFTTAEVALARSLGWLTIGLGPTILRVETAGIAGCAAVLALAKGRKNVPPEGPTTTTSQPPSGVPSWRPRN